jgi:hypothetical protein
MWNRTLSKLLIGIFLIFSIGPNLLAQARPGAANPYQSGNVEGPSSATDGHLVVFDGTDGKKVKDGGAVPEAGGDTTNMVEYEGSPVTDGNVVIFDGTTGKAIKDGGALPVVPDVSDMVEYGGSPVTDGHLVVFDGTDGKSIKDGGVVPVGGSYTPPGTGAVETTYAEVVQRRVSVLDFMTAAHKAKCLNGTIDEDVTYAYTAAEVYLSSLYRTGGTIYQPSGKYAANVSIQTQGINLEGESFVSSSSEDNCIVPWNVNLPALTIGDGTHDMYGGFVTKISLYGEGPNGTGLIGLYLPGGCQDWSFDKISVRRFANYEIYVTSGKVLTVNYPNEYMYFTNIHVSGGSGHTNIALVYMEMGLSWVTVVSFKGYHIHSGVSESGITLDGVVLWSEGGWIQGAGTGSGTDCVGVTLLKSASWTPKIWGWSTSIEVTGGGTGLRIYETTARKNASLYVIGMVTFTATGGTVYMKSADNTTTAISATDVPKLPYLTELFQPRIVEEAWFAHSADPAAANASIKLTSANKLQISNGPTGTVAIIGVLGVGTSSPAAAAHINGVPGAMFRLGLNTASTGGGLVFNNGETTATLSGASTTVAVAIPTGALLRGVQIRVDTEITSGDGATSWSASFSGGSTTALTTGQAFAKSTRVNVFVPYEICTNTTNVVITPNSGTFSGGVVRVLPLFETLATMSAAP